MKSTLKVAAALAAVVAVPAMLSAGVMMQGFYWDTPSGWYNTMKSNANGLRYMAGGFGLNRMYFPPPCKGQGGGYSMGYDVADYYDLGAYNQHGWTATRFGTHAELKSAASTYRGLGVVAMADIVLNHRSGGASENNPNLGYSTYTNFQYQMSGKALWHYNEFHPSSYWGYDEGAFGGYSDVCHRNPFVWNDLKDWGNWLKVDANAGFNGGWRQDYVKGFGPWMVKDFRQYTNWSYSIGEYWDANTSTLDWWANAADSGAFDFAGVYTGEAICNNGGGGGYMPNYIDSGKTFAAKNSGRAVTFAGNHDTDPITRDKMIQYAWMLTYQGYPCVWWKDYFNYGLASVGGQWGNGIKQLTWVREKLGAGGPNTGLLKTNDGNCLIYCDRDGNSSSPGFIIVINDDSYAWRGSWVQSQNTNLRNKTLKCYAWYSPNSGQNYQPASKYCDGNGWVEVWAPPRGYAVYAPDGY
ncbi:MAG: alpha-amylase domain-containing protein [Candidatus Sumerlaeia bacterium]|nr:alpha-amylase domain-containing protein [Candidatus Sumerlaeia bacterium]